MERERGVAEVCGRPSRHLNRVLLDLRKTNVDEQKWKKVLEDPPRQGSLGTSWSSIKDSMGVQAITGRGQPRRQQISGASRDSKTGDIVVAKFA